MLFLTCFSQPVFVQEVASSDVLKAIKNGADYAVSILLDEEGKSRCDYNMTEGKWYPYEEPWHTGQVIYGLLEAYQVTDDRRYLDAARKAGDWWCGLEIKEGKLKGMLKAYHGDDAGDVIVFATVSDGTPGLFRLSEVSREPKYAATATRCWCLDARIYV